MTEKPLTARQQEILSAVAQLGAELSRPPTVTELAGHINISRQNTREHVWRLRERGFVNFKAQDRQALTPVLTNKARALLGHPGFAVLGSIAAGQPLHAGGQLEAYTNHISDLLAVQEGDFLLRVEGDSMIGAGYFPGDYVAVHPTSDAQEGEIVVAFLPEEETATLKRLYKDEDGVLLVAENHCYEPLRLAADKVKIQGVVVGHIGGRRDRKALRELL